MLDGGYAIAKMTGDGSCLFYAASVALSGVDAYGHLLRVATYDELVSRKQYYLQELEKTPDIRPGVLVSDANDIILELLGHESWELLFDLEAERGVTLHAEGGLLQLWGLSNVIKRPIRSIYSKAGVHAMACNRIYFPREITQEEIRVQWSVAVVRFFSSFSKLNPHIQN